MLNVPKRVNHPTYFNEREKRSMIQTLQSLLIITFFAGVGGLVLAILSGYGWILILPFLFALLAVTASFVLLRRGILLPGRILLPAALYIAVTFINASGYASPDITLIAFGIVVIVAGLTLGQDAPLPIGLLIILTIFIITFANDPGILLSGAKALPVLSTPLLHSMMVLVIAFAQRTLIKQLYGTARLAWENEQKQIEANQMLQEERSRLEQRVSERTAVIERHAVLLRTAAEVANASASLQDIKALLNQTTRLIGLRFGYYHAGIFLLDDDGKFAVLRAANSEGGRRMLERGHKLEVGRVGIVGFVAERGEARIALDVGADAVYFDNPDLPNTHSEIALPLRVGGHVAGVLDVQSAETSAFHEEDIEILQIVADQLAVSIDNARLLEESHAAAEAARRAFGEIAQAAWKERFDTGAAIGFRAGERGGVSSVDTKTWSVEALRSAMEAKVITSKDESTIYVPILVRGQTIGILKLARPDHAQWTPDETQTAETIADQMSSALESARLFDSAQRRAAKEQALGEITSKISASTNMHNVLQTAVEELGRALPGSEVIIQFQSGGESERPERES